DTPRLVYADWLQENGDPDRAEFIRLQVQLARLSEGDGRQLELRANDLLARHEDEWVRPVRGLVLWYRFERGFVGTVGVEAVAFLASAAGLFRLAPVRYASIQVGAGEVAAVAASPHLARLRSLHIGDEAGDAGAEWLAGSPHLAGVEFLNLSRNGVGPAG